MSTLPSRAPRDIRTLVSSPIALAFAALFAIGAVMVIPAFPKERGGSSQSSAQAAPLPPVSADDRAKIAQWWEMQPKIDLPIANDGAKVLIVKFNDYQCPACKLTHETYKAMLQKYIASGQVKYVLKHYPLEPECNANTPTMNHFASCEASAAVIMAGPKGTSAALEDWIFGHIGPPMLTAEQVKDAARTVGGITDFDAQYARVKEQIKVDTGLGGLLGVKGTPTFYINGRSPTTVLPAQYFEVLIQLELERAK